MNPIPVKRRVPLRYTVDETVAKVHISKYVCLLDAADLPMLEGWTLSVTKARYVLLTGSYRETPMRRVLLSRYLMNPPEEKDVDHISGDTLDNRRANLRVCSRRENLQNGSRHADSASPYKGVCYGKRQWGDKKWLANICHNGHTYYLGSFLTAEEAAEAYNRKARELFGEYARLNTIETKSQNG